jgi:hypothetical protein
VQGVTSGREVWKLKEKRRTNNVRESPEFLNLGAARVTGGQLSVRVTKQTLNWPEGETAPLENSGGWSALHVLSTGGRHEVDAKKKNYCQSDIKNEATTNEQRGVDVESE